MSALEQLAQSAKHGHGVGGVVLLEVQETRQVEPLLLGYLVLRPVHIDGLLHV